VPNKFGMRLQAKLMWPRSKSCHGGEGYNDHSTTNR
jgi:hypothetical protein